MKRTQIICRHVFSSVLNTVNCTIRHCRQYSLWDILFCLSSAAFVLFWIPAHFLAQSLAAQHDYRYDILYYLQNLAVAVGIGGLLYLAAAFLPPLGRIPKTIANWIVVMMFLSTLLVFAGILVLILEPISAPTPYFSTVDSETILLGRIIDSYQLTGIGDNLPYLADLELYYLSRLMEDHLLCLLAYRYGSWIIVLLSIIAAIWLISAVSVYLRLYSRWFEWIFLTSFCPAAFQIITPILDATGLWNDSRIIMDPFYACDVVTISFFLTIPLTAMLVVTKWNHDSI